MGVITETPGFTRSSQSWMPFGIALAHQEHDRRGVGRGIVRQPLLPVGRDLARLGGDRVDVGGERQRHDVGLQPVDHRARLRAGAAVRVLDRHRLAGLRLPVGGEGGVDRLIEFARRIVGDVEQRDVGARGGRRGRRRKDGEPGEPTKGTQDSEEFHADWSLLDRPSRILFAISICLVDLLRNGKRTCGRAPAARAAARVYIAAFAH